MPKRKDIHKVLIIGSGPIIIGQACEFDYSGTQACKALKEEGYEVVLVNSNPATIMTDPGMAHKTYIEPLTVESVEKIIEKERPDALLPNLGGQTGLNLSSSLHKAGVLEKYNVEVIGVKIDAIERGEDRIAFKEAMNRLGVPIPKSAPSHSIEEAEKIFAFPARIGIARQAGRTLNSQDAIIHTSTIGLATRIAGEYKLRHSGRGFMQRALGRFSDIYESYF